MYFNPAAVDAITITTATSPYMLCCAAYKVWAAINIIEGVWLPHNIHMNIHTKYITRQCLADILTAYRLTSTAPRSRVRNE